MSSAALAVYGVPGADVGWLRHRGENLHRDRWVSAMCVVGAIGVGAASTFRPKLAVVLVLCVAVFVVVGVRPHLGGYLLIGLTPLIAGIDRGTAIPLLRPSEALAFAVGAALATSAVLRTRSGDARPVRLTHVELAILALAVCNSIVPMIWMAARDVPITSDDLLYALVIWKYAGIYLIVRVSITTVAQVMRCLWISVSVAAVVAGVAILQSLSLFGVPQLLARYYAPFGYTGALDHARGSSTLALPAATADLLIYNLAIAAGLWIRCPRQRPLLAVLSTTFAIGVLAAGEFSSAIGLVVAICAIAFVTSYPRLLSIFIPLAGAAVILLRPVIARRLQGFDSVSGLPVSWTGRLSNLHNYFWPKLFSDWNYVLGVRPSARVTVSYQATGYVWIESGYTWLLWGGGIPLAAAFVYFVLAAIRMSWREARRAVAMLNPAAIGVFVSVVVMTVLMVFDPHLTYRGAAEEMFGLLALALVWARQTRIGAASQPVTPSLEGQP